MSVAVIAEKPSVARDIARVLGADRKGEGCYHGGGYTVSWALGHLVGLAEPHEMNPSWRAWRRELLPMLPRKWELKVLEKTRSQFRVVEKILRDRKTEKVICATDAGREGELIFRYVYEKARCTKRVDRLWISSLTPSAIRRGLASLKGGDDYDDLAAAAKGRSRADWLVGMNLSRAYTLAHDGVLSVGRVQTPTLAMLVDRRRAIEAFVPEDYLEVVATFGTPGGSYAGVYIDEKGRSRLPADGESARAIAERSRSGEARIEQIKRERKRRPPPLLYDLTELQRHANRLFGFSAKKTLQIAQRLYEKHKLISYPRTDSRHLSRDVADTLPGVVPVIRGPYEEMLAPGTGERPLSGRFVNDGKVSDHHAIIPTSVSPKGLLARSDEQRIYDLICRRLLQAWHGDHVASVTTVTTAVSSVVRSGDPTIVDRFRGTGSQVIEEGWRVLEPPRRKKKKRDGKDRYRDQRLPSEMAEGDSPEVEGTEILEKQTKPPRPFTEATLLTAMETAGRAVEDKALSDAMRENGLGTPATRAAIIETLLSREYVSRRGKALHATDKGAQLIDVVDEAVKNPAMTGLWEHRLREIERGRESLNAFMADIETYVRQVVGGIGARPSSPVSVTPLGKTNAFGPSASRREDCSSPAVDAPPPEDPTWGPPPGWNDVPPPEDDVYFDGESPPPEPPLAPPRASPPVAPPRPVEGAGDGSIEGILTHRFGFDGFRPHQEAVCRAVVQGESVLLVMPTGAGKSLCYQLPGIARGGTTLVVSPLIALMEDQTAALRQRGFAAERIHSGLSREEAREVCRQYLRGALDFLFIAPERLGVPGFPEMLAKRLPVLIAVDEAHCISHWGHDFRPDYRMLNERLSSLRAAPVIALTATATPLVQRDITVQLGMPEARRFIHGFRRTNIAIEVVEMPQRAREEAVTRLLGDPERRPAIVYAPTRKGAETLAETLAGRMPAAAYHAGMNPGVREQVQTNFISGRLEVIVATIAFGMGIDKPDVRTVVHAALPGSIEGYYQEIGRAGRDGLPSRAVLLHAYADTKTHEFFLERDYPEPAVLAQVYDLLTDRKQPRENLQRALGLDDERLGAVLEKLWIHGGAAVSPDERVSRGSAGWRKPYLEQRRHKEEQLALMAAYAQSAECRMLRLVRHFGDQEDRGERCGVCDICEPTASSARQTRAASREEQRLMQRLLDELQLAPSQAKGKLYRERFEDDLTRNEFESLVEGLFRAGLIAIEQDRFTKGGRTIEFQRLSITARGYRAFRERGGVTRDIEVTVVAPPKRRPARKRRSSASGKGTKKKASKAKQPASFDGAAPSPALVEALKGWRLELARKRGIPAFRILTDRTLNNIAAARPTSGDELLQISGVGETLLKKYGKQVLAICGRVAG